MDEDKKGSNKNNFYKRIVCYTFIHMTVVTNSFFTIANRKSGEMKELRGSFKRYAE
ncbi:unnamed protein product [Brugia pahangi]|uniref:Uncharacterized protein n=1 Tax=Brugia pahangi TaxID=6280 RepID=A0A0N4TEH3_BRUPA|nr:unnamed protein product [Brugia pahangi]